MKKIVLVIIYVICFYKISNAQTELWGVTSYGGQVSTFSGIGGGVVFKVDSSANNFSNEYVFPSLGGNSRIYAPYNGSLIEANDGMMYGYARRNAGWSMLCLFQYDFQNNVIEIKYNSVNGIDGKEPMGALIQATNGLLYGIMNQGGTNDLGTLYSFDPVTNQFAKKIDFDYPIGTYPEGSLFQAANGKIYGTTRSGGLYNYGALYEYNPVTNTIITLVHFDGSNVNIGSAPLGALMQGSDGLLYGTTSAGGVSNAGVIFSYNITTNTYMKRKDFATSTGPFGLGTGAWPHDALIEGVDGNFYGLTTGSTQVWPCSGGTIFQFNPNTNGIVTKYAFSLSEGTNPNGSLVIGPDGNFYGLTTNTMAGKSGSLFKYDYLNDVFTSKYFFDGYDYGGTPTGSLIKASNGKLFGMTREGGSERQGGQVQHYGTLFEFDTTLDTLQKKFDFGLSYNGELGTLMYSNNKFYGTTSQGGIHNDGTIFEYDPGTRQYKKIFDFDENINGAGPIGAPTKMNDSTLYIVTSSGGANGKGVLLKFNPINSTVAKKIDFAGGLGGENPAGSLVLATNGMLYGLTYSGGSGNGGILYQYNPTTNIVTNKFNFSYSTSGSGPIDHLIQASNGKLYGVTGNGGPGTNGTLFQFDISTNTFTKKYDFSSTTGINPVSSLIEGVNGKIFGLTKLGGLNNKGVFFQYDPITNIYTKKSDFDGTNTGNPAFSGSLMKTSNGKIFGMTSHGGQFDTGIIFKFDTLTNTILKTYEFVTNNGTLPSINSLVETPVLPSTQLTSVSNILCKGNTVMLSYTTTGTFNPNNVFDVELSNAFGYFNYPITVGSTTANTSGTITITVPLNIINGSGYKFRVKSSDPYTISYPTNYNINISAPSLNLTNSSTQICQGSSITLNLTGANSYTWNTGTTSSSININPTITTTYTVVGTNSVNCSSSQTIEVTVDNTCQSVWPGDANSDGIADNLDVLELGLHFTQSGAVRTATSNVWQAYTANNWAGTISNGKNMNHSDCNGDGIINTDDTIAIYNNYGLTHAFKLSNIQSTNPVLNIVSDQNLVNTGTWGTSSVYLGDATNPMSNVNGLAFTLNYDKTLIETDSIYLEYSNSFINSGQNLHFRKYVFTSSFLHTATTHTNNVNTNGYGKIATLHYKIKPTLTANSTLNISATQAFLSNASGSISPITSGTASLTAIALTTQLNHFANGSLIYVYPNPTSSELYIETNTSIENATVKLTNALGQVVLTEIINSKQQLTTSGLAKGIYLLELWQGNNILFRNKLVKE